MEQPTKPKLVILRSLGKFGSAKDGDDYGAVTDSDAELVERNGLDAALGIEKREPVAG